MFTHPNQQQDYSHDRAIATQTHLASKEANLTPFVMQFCDYLLRYGITLPAEYSPHVIQQHNYDYDHLSFQSLIKLMMELNIIFTKDLFIQIMAMSNKNLMRLTTLIEDLRDAHLLNDVTLAEAVKRITLKLPTATETSASKSLSTLCIDQQLVLHKLNKEKIRGGFGTIKQYGLTPNATDPAYIIKTIKTETDLSCRLLDYSPLMAKREIKYHHLLGRHAYFFKIAQKSRVALQWLGKKSLDKFSSNEIDQIRIQDRIEFMVSLLNELNIIHEHFRIHGDIKPANVILDKENSQAHLIDFGGSFKRGSKNFRLWTEEYCEKHTSVSSLDCATDIYSLGIIFALFFPMHFSTEYHKAKKIYEISPIAHDNENELDKSIKILINSMLDQKSFRPNAQDALCYVVEVQAHRDALINNQETTDTSRTLHREKTSLEDVFRGIKRHRQ